MQIFEEPKTIDEALQLAPKVLALTALVYAAIAPPVGYVVVLLIRRIMPAIKVTLLTVVTVTSALIVGVAIIFRGLWQLTPLGPLPAAIISLLVTPLIVAVFTVLIHRKLYITPDAESADEDVSYWMLRAKKGADRKALRAINREQDPHQQGNRQD